MSAFILVCNALTVVFILAALLFGEATRYYTRQTARILAGLPEQPKPWTVRLADPLLRRGRK